MKTRVSYEAEIFFRIAYLLCFLFFGCAAKITAQTGEVKISGETIIVINDGDFVHPKISPDGNQIAYSRVVVQDKTELAEIAVRNLKTKQEKILLTAKKSEKYATYAAFVSHLEWLDDNKLLAFVSDGDVDSAKLTFDFNKNRIINTEYSSAGDDFDFISPELEFALKPIREITPDIPEEVLQTGLQDGNGAFTVGKCGVVLKYRYYGYDDNIRFFDFQNKTEKILLEVSAKSKQIPELLGGFVFGEKIIFVVKIDETLRIYEHTENQTELLTEQKFDGSETFNIKYQTPEKILFLISPYSTTSEMKSTLWLFDKDGLKKTDDLPNLLDVDIKSNRIAYCFWTENKKRHIIVKELKF